MAKGWKWRMKENSYKQYVLGLLSDGETHRTKTSIKRKVHTSSHTINTNCISKYILAITLKMYT